MTRCPQCSRLATRGAYLCQCGYEFNGMEAEAEPAPGEIPSAGRILAPKVPALPRKIPRFVPVLILLVGIGLISTLSSVGREKQLRTWISGCACIEISFVIFTFRAFKRMDRSPLSVLLGIFLLLLSALGLGIAVIGAACAFSRFP